VGDALKWRLRVLGAKCFDDIGRVPAFARRRLLKPRQRGRRSRRRGESVDLPIDDRGRAHGRGNRARFQKPATIEVDLRRRDFMVRRRLWNAR
jgi:hypothetical protein